MWERNSKKWNKLERTGYSLNQSLKDFFLLFFFFYLYMINFVFHCKQGQNPNQDLKVTQEHIEFSWILININKTWPVPSKVEQKMYMKHLI